jgi:peptidoglycan/LPS O-acetylase OafA/YrhL
MDSLGFGVAIAYYYNVHHEGFVELLTPWRKLLVVAGTIMLVPNFLLELGVSPYVHTIGFTVNYIACGMVMVGVLLSDFSRRRWIVPFATLGVYSYSIYLWHLAVSQRAIPWLTTKFDISHSFWVWFAMYIGGALALGVAMALLVEMPALAIRDRFFPSRSSGAVAKAEISG